MSIFLKWIDSPGIEQFQYSRYPYYVQPHVQKSPTYSEVESLLKAALNDSLRDRVQWISDQNSFIVDKFFRFQLFNKSTQEGALKFWSDLGRRCQRIGIGVGIGAVGLTVLALRGTPLYIEVALFVAIVVSCCFAGWSLQRTQLAQHQHDVWRSPAEDFAIRRKASLELPLDKILKQKCHYHLDQQEGTLLAIEIFYLIAQNFKRFTEPLMTRKCEDSRQEHQWVIDFFSANPLISDFFHDNPRLVKEKEWKEVQAVQKQIAETLEIMKKLRDQFAPQFSKKERAAKQKLNRVMEMFEARVNIVVENLSLDADTTQVYQQRLLYTLEKELFHKVARLVEQHREKSTYPFSLVYLQVRSLAEQCNKWFLEQQPLDLTAVSNFAIPNFRQQFHAIVQDYRQHVIEKAKSLAPDEPAYLDFVAKIFKPFNKH